MVGQQYRKQGYYKKGIITVELILKTTTRYNGSMTRGRDKGGFVDQSISLS